MPKYAHIVVDVAAENDARAERAAEALRHYPNDDPYADPSTNLTDFLTDLLHLCDREGISLHDALRMAGEHYTAELRGE